MQVTQLKRPHTVETIHIRKNCVLVGYLMHPVIWSSEGLRHELYPIFKKKKKIKKSKRIKRNVKKVKLTLWEEI